MKIACFFFAISIFACSCSVKPPQQYTAAEKYDNTISDGYTKTEAHNRTGAGNSVEHPNTIIPLDNYLRGLAGVNVVGAGSSATVRVRGISSFTATSNEPLFILNGMALSSYSVAFNSINANDIKRVTVLTDAASTGIYGSRASNGVIVITLKNAK